MDRRRFLATSLSTPLLVPLLASAQSRVARIAFLEGGNVGSHLWRATREGLHDLGYVEGQNLTVEFRSADGHFDRLPQILAELIGLRVDVIVTIGDPVVAAAKAATSTIPIVMAGAGDPVGRGFVSSLARPGGNITGLSNYAVTLTGKWLELAREIVPGIPRVAILRNAGNPTHPLFWAEGEASASRLGLAVYSAEVRGPDDFDPAFAAMTRERVGAVVMLPDPMLGSHRTRLAELSMKLRLPSISSFRENTENGCLISYGPSLAANFRRAASFIDRILKGAKPGELPIEQPTTFEMVVNLKTARALALTIPPALLARTDRVIE
jgi:putative ABC transport system substrate-binding protein